MIGRTVEAIASSTATRPAHVVLLDDDPTHRTLLRLLLDRQDPSLVVHESDRQEDALRHLRDLAARGMPVLVLADQRLADGTGLAFFDRLRREQPDAAFTFVLLSATRDGIEPAPLARAGVARFIEKPLRLAHYERALEALLASWRGTKTS